MGGGPNAPYPKPGSGTGQPLTWEPNEPNPKPGSGKGQPLTWEPKAPNPKPGSGTGQPQTWEQLKRLILTAIKMDEQPYVFKDLLANVSEFMAECERTG